mmetsp:Transcript_11602/g.48265  ORF Transcript_11602/g.48265 Transcript_11602/m.48265 type:complete len:83 (-) Transcript_11602:1649-1897(-)
MIATGKATLKLGASNLGHCPVEKDLQRNVQHVYGFLKMTQQQHVSSLVVTIAEGMVIDVAEHGLALGPFLPVAVNEYSQLLK